MSECPHCQETIPEDVEFCIFCGERVSDASESVRDKITKKDGALASATVEKGPLVEALQSAPSSIDEQASEPVASAEPASSSELKPGAVVDGKYEVERLLGEGGMGVVYLARDVHTGVEVVIKAIRSEYAHREDFRQRTLQEGRSLARIDHPNVVSLNAVVVEEEELFLVMQYIDGESLADRVARYAAEGTKMPLDEVSDLFSQVLKGVGAAHQEGVIHRDLKPPNILIRERDGVVKVTDFGIAKPEEDAKAGRGQTKGIIGSLHYMAPEQLLGHRDLDKRVDIYGLGILLFELLTGHVPFDGPSDYDIMKLHVEGTLPRVSLLRTDVTTKLDEVIERACAKERADRFDSTDQFLRAFEHAVESRPLPDTVIEAPVAQALVSDGSALSEAIESDLGQNTESPDAEKMPKRSKAFVLISLLFVGAIALAIAIVTYQMGMWEPLWDVPGLPIKKRPKLHPKVMSSGQSAVVPVNSAQPASPISALVGRWKSDTGSVYDAVMVGKLIELRFRTPGDLAKRGYVQGESRFKLIPLPGKPNVFAVEEKVRPQLPKTLRYDLKVARRTCQAMWSTANKKKLRARLVRDRLIVDTVKTKPSLSLLVRKGNRVVSCRNLERSKVARVESSLVRLSN